MTSYEVFMQYTFEHFCHCGRNNFKLMIQKLCNMISSQWGLILLKRVNRPCKVKVTWVSCREEGFFFYKKKKRESIFHSILELSLYLRIARKWQEPSTKFSVKAGCSPAPPHCCTLPTPDLRLCSQFPHLQMKELCQVVVWRVSGASKKASEKEELMRVNCEDQATFGCRRHLA